jgi:hypothetical protein
MSLPQIYSDVKGYSPIKYIALAMRNIENPIHATNDEEGE